MVQHVGERHHCVRLVAIDHQPEDPAADGGASPTELHEGHGEGCIVVADQLVILSEVADPLFNHVQKAGALQLVEFELLVEDREARVLLW